MSGGNTKASATTATSGKVIRRPSKTMKVNSAHEFKANQMVQATNIVRLTPSTDVWGQGRPSGSTAQTEVACRSAISVADP